MNYLQVDRYGKPMSVFFNGDLSDIQVWDKEKQLQLSAEDKASLRDIIEQEIYLTVMDLAAKGTVRDA